LSAVTLAAIAAALEAEGLRLLGAFHPAEDDAVPPLTDGRACGTLILAGNIGGSLWPAFSAAPEAGDGTPDALDRWSARVLGGLAASFGGEPLYPFGGPPYRPFQRWARRGEPLTPSPLGMLIHPDYGLWHAYRGALAFPHPLDLPPSDVRPIPCRTCADKPCLSACPVGAFTAAGYDVPRCVKHISTEAGADCMGQGCRARRACPVGRAARYDPAQSRFHMEAFLRARSEA